MSYGIPSLLPVKILVPFTLLAEICCFTRHCHALLWDLTHNIFPRTLSRLSNAPGLGEEEHPSTKFDTFLKCSLVHFVVQMNTGY